MNTKQKTSDKPAKQKLKLNVKITRELSEEDLGQVAGVGPAGWSEWFSCLPPCNHNQVPLRRKLRLRRR